MAKWRDDLEQRATRGRHRGPDAVFDAASMADYAPASTDRPGRRNVALVAAGAVAVAAIGGGTVLVAQGSGGDAPRSTPPARCAVFLLPGASVERIDELRELVAVDGALTDVEALSQEDAYAEFSRRFGQKPELVESVSPEVLPPSVRGFLADPTAARVSAFESHFDALPDVRDATCGPIADGVLVSDDADCWITTLPNAPESTHEEIRALLEHEVDTRSYTYRDMLDSPVPIYEVHLAAPSVAASDELLGRVAMVSGISGADCPPS